MIILATGAFMVLGLIQFGLFEHRKRIQTFNSDYAKDIQAKNVAHTAIQLAMEQINDDPSWQPTSVNPWTREVDGAYFELYYDVLATGATATDPDSIRIYSTAWFGGKGAKGSSDYKADSETHQIISTYLKSGLHFVPEAVGGLGLASGNFNFNMSGSASISGNDASGTCADIPAITVPTYTDYLEVVTGAKVSNLESDEDLIAIDPNISYSPVDQLIERLSNQPGVVDISGNYKGDFGTADDPGIFFVESYAKLTGGVPEGFGILVIRSGGELEYEGALSVAGNFTFNGLIIFENAFDFDGKGTPDLNGSVLIGNTPGNNTTLDIDLGGSLQIQYDCQAIDYAKVASATHLKQNRYTRVSTFE